MNVHITIFNFQREAMLDQTISEIESWTVNTPHEVSYTILDDGSKYNRPNMVKFQHAGKAGFWQKWDYALNQCEIIEADVYIFIPNDFSNIDFEGMLHQHTKQTGAYVFNIVNDGREMCWNTIRPVQMAGMKQVFFTDCGFFCNKETIKALDYEVYEVPKSRFSGFRSMSSGVGEQLTTRLNALNIPMYTPDSSFAFHGEHASTMHPSERKRNPLISQHQTKPTRQIVVGIATMNSRKKSLAKTLASINAQSVRPDRIYIYNNDENAFNATDNAKFYGLAKETEPVIFLSMDDDILYPPSYIKDMVAAVEKHECIVTHHGRSLVAYDRNYYSGHKIYNCLRKNNFTGEIHVAGTGVTAFDTEYFNPVEVFRSQDKRMSDCVFSLMAAEQSKRIVVLKHQTGYIKDVCTDVENSCYLNEHKSPTRQNEIANQILNIKYSNKH